jgi:hypothetical protein
MPALAVWIVSFKPARATTVPIVLVSVAPRVPTSW